MMATISLQNAQTAGRGVLSAMPSLFMAAGMFVGSLVMPIVNRKYADRRKARQERVRQEKYVAYLGATGERIRAIGERQKTSLLCLYPNANELLAILRRADSRIWERMRTHADFLCLRLGVAALPIDVAVRFPKHQFSVNDDVLRDALTRFESGDRIVDGMPLILSLKETGILGVIGAHADRMRYIKGLLMQLCFQHSYEELKLVLIHREDDAEWEFARWFPHVWSDGGEMRALALRTDDMRAISAYIDLFSQAEAATGVHCVVIAADMALASQCLALSAVLDAGGAGGVSVVALARQSGELPRQCRSVIVVKDGEGTLYPGIDQMRKPIPFILDDIPHPSAREFATRLNRLRLTGARAEGALPDTLTFLEMLRCGNVEQLGARARWRQSDPVKTLAAPVGVDKFGAPIELDLHQDAHGPHGLVAGMTGSGKSEFIITYILSLAAHYSPLEVGFILIDYKGGGMSDTLAGLPHVVGVIDNLGGKQGIHRSMTSIKSEIKRRQRIFKEVGKATQNSNLDIYKYQGMYRRGDVTEPLQHLFIISDEFAELKQQEPDFMDDLVSAARIGRSLGIHLILATQKPTGVVNAQILSNTRFRVCLKVQDRSDSMEMLGKPDAAALVKTGRFYLQVGVNEVYALGQSAWSGATYAPKPRYEAEIDDSVELLDDLGRTVCKAKPDALREGGTKKQVDEIVTYLRGQAEAASLMPEPIWKPQLQDNVLLTDIEQTYGVAYKPFALDPLVGLADDPAMQSQYPLQLDMTEHGNVILYGSANSGKEEFLRAVMYSLCTRHTPEEVNVYCLDFADETSRMFLPMPHVGDVMVAGDDEKIINFIAFLTEETARRRKLLSSYGGSLEAYRAGARAFMPNLLVIVHNYAAFIEAYEQCDDDMFRLIREGTRFGVYYIVTCMASNSVRFRLTQNFKSAYCLQMPEKNDYVSVLGSTDGVLPMPRRGSGLLLHEYVQEFQVANILRKPEEDAERDGEETRALLEQYQKTLFQHVQEQGRRLSDAWRGRRAERVRVLPRVVALADVCASPASVSLDAVPIGIEKQSMLPLTWDVGSRALHMILYKIAPEYAFCRLLAGLLAANPKRRVILLDALDGARGGETAYALAQDKSALEKRVDALFDETLARHNAARDAREQGGEPPAFDELVIIVDGMSELYERLADNPERVAKLDAVLRRGVRALSMCTLFTQNIATIGALKLKPWYAALTDTDGLWLGMGIAEQYTLKTGNYRPESDADGDFGYLVRRGKVTACKMLTE